MTVDLVITTAAVVALAVAAVALIPTNHPAAAIQGDDPDPILRCFSPDGAVVETAPRVDDFLMRQQGTLIEARWTNPNTRTQEVMVTSLGCVYRTTSPAAGSVGANGAP